MAPQRVALPLSIVSIARPTSSENHNACTAAVTNTKRSPCRTPRMPVERERSVKVLSGVGAETCASKAKGPGYPRATTTSHSARSQTRSEPTINGLDHVPARPLVNAVRILGIESIGGADMPEKQPSSRRRRGALCARLRALIPTPRSRSGGSAGPSRRWSGRASRSATRPASTPPRRNPMSSSPMSMVVGDGSSINGAAGSAPNATSAASSKPVTPTSRSPASDRPRRKVRPGIDPPHEMAAPRSTA